MKFLKKALAPKEVRAAIGVLDEAACTFDNQAFQIVREQIEEMILGRPDEFVALVQKGTSPRQWIYTVIANIAGDHVESGQHHIYRGVLNPLGPGEDMLKLFDAAVDELVRLGSFDAEYASEQKQGLRENMKTVG